MKVALPASPFNRRDLFEQAGFDVVEAPVRSTEDFIIPDGIGDEMKILAGMLKS